MRWAMQTTKPGEPLNLEHIAPGSIAAGIPVRCVIQPFEQKTILPGGEPFGESLPRIFNTTLHLDGNLKQTLSS